MDHRPPRTKVAREIPSPTTYAVLLVLGDEDRLVAAVAIAWQVETNQAVVRQFRLRRGAVTVVVLAHGAHLARAIAQVMAQLNPHRPPDQGLLEIQADRLNLLRRHRPLDEAVHELRGILTPEAEAALSRFLRLLGISTPVGHHMPRTHKS